MKSETDHCCPLAMYLRGHTDGVFAEFYHQQVIFHGKNYLGKLFPTITTTSSYDKKYRDDFEGFSPSTHSNITIL